MPLRFKIGVVGCGAVGSYYGAKLASSGNDVHFLLRSDYAAVLRDGVRILSPLGDFTARPVAARNPGEIGPCDLILVALKTTANHQLQMLIPPMLSPGTIVITLQNGLGNEDALAGFVPPERVMGGLCFVCLNRIAPGIVRHMAHGHVMLGELMPEADSRLELVAELFRRASIACETTKNLIEARWEKLIWNVPFNGLGVASAAGLEALDSGHVDVRALQPCLTTDKLISNPGWEKLVRGLMREVIFAARSQGLNLPLSLVENKLDLTRSMGPYKPSTLLDFETKQPLELESMFLEPLRRAKEAGAKVPLLEKLCAVLKQLEGWNIRGPVS